MDTSSYWIYILECDNNTYYTGYTTDLKRRYQEHLAGTAKCKYTRSFKPVNIAQSWQLNCEKSKVMQIEKYIKKMSKKEKQQLILAPAQFFQLFQLILDK